MYFNRDTYNTLPFSRLIADMCQKFVNNGYLFSLGIIYSGSSLCYAMERIEVNAAEKLGKIKRDDMDISLIPW